MSTKTAYSYLIKILSSRDFSEHKLREKLRGRNYPANEIDEAIAEVKSKNFLREDNYIEARIKAFMNKGYSPNYIQQKLEQEHIQVAETIIEDVFTEHKLTTIDQIDRLVRKKLNINKVVDFDAENKILRYLLSKGHDFGTSKKVMKAVIAEEKSIH
jgi:regulatory protein